jgi:hypothetical protein
VSSSPFRLTFLVVVLVAAFAAPPAHAQFTAAGGLVAPGALPPGGFGVGGFAGLGGMGWGGWGTQWMQNPYEGYLNGAANMTMANAQYQQTIQQAKLTRQEATRSSFQTRRAAIEERQYELSLMPDPEKIRQDQMMRSLQRSRNNPPQVEIWSGKALNDLLRAIQDSQTRGTTGPNVPLSPDVLRHVSFTSGTTRGGPGLLKDGGKLTWPYALRRSDFDSERTQIDEQMQQAVRQAQSGQVSADLLDKVGESLKQLERSIDSRALQITPDQYIQATRYLRELKDSYRVLQQSDVAKYFRPAWTPQGASVGELVRQMTKEGLSFAPAVSGDETYYTSLHRSMVDYDMGIAQLRATAPTP